MPQPLTLALLEGDGIGPEITQATRKVLETVSDSFNLNLQFHESEIGFAALKKYGSTLPGEVVELARESDGIVLGPVSHADYPKREDGGLNPSGELRKQLDLYANIRPARTRAGIPARCGIPIDLIIVRENTEGFYADRCLHMGPGEFMPTPDLAMSLRKVSRHASMRIAEAAFHEAAKRRGKVTAVHKANVLRIGDGLFLDCCRTVAEQYTDIEYNERIIDAMCAHLVRGPDAYDVICTTNMFGDILSDLASELSGSLGLAASLNAGETHAMAQAQHGSAPDIAGRDIANPSSLIGSAAMLLEWLGSRRDDNRLAFAARAIDQALETVLSQPEHRTPDLGGKLGTQAFAQRVAKAIG